MMNHGEQEHHIVSYDSLSSIALSDDVIERARKFDVEWTGHEVEPCASSDAHTKQTRKLRDAQATSFELPLPHNRPWHTLPLSDRRRLRCAGKVSASWREPNGFNNMSRRLPDLCLFNRRAAEEGLPHQRLIAGILHT